MKKRNPVEQAARDWKAARLRAGRRAARGCRGQLNVPGARPTPMLGLWEDMWWLK